MWARCAMPGMSRPAAARQPERQAPAPVVIDLTHRRRSLTRPSLGDPHPREKRTGRTNVTCYGTRCGPREMGTWRRLHVSDEFAPSWPVFQVQTPGPEPG